MTCDQVTLRVTGDNVTRFIRVYAERGDLFAKWDVPLELGLPARHGWCPQSRYDYVPPNARETSYWEVIGMLEDLSGDPAMPHLDWTMEDFTEWVNSLEEGN